MTLREIGGELISAFADAVLAFIRDPEAVQQFHREQRRWITWQMPEPRSDGKILNAIGQLLSSDDPVDDAFLSRLTLGRADEREWRAQMRIYYDLRTHLTILRRRLEVICAPANAP